MDWLEKGYETHHSVHIPMSNPKNNIMKKSLKNILCLFLLLPVFLTECNNVDQSASSKQIVEKYVEYWNTADFAGIENLLHTDFEIFTSPKFESSSGIDHFKENIINLHTAYPDFKLILDEMIIDVDKAAGRWTITGTYTEHGSTPPTGKSIKVKGMSILHFKDGKIVDEWISGYVFKASVSISRPDLMTSDRHASESE